MKLQKIILSASIAGLSACLLSVNAAAYLDPSAVTYSIQIIVGIVVAAGAAAGIIITKIKKKAKDKLGIDLEKKKEIEEEIVVSDELDIDSNTEKMDSNDTLK